MGDKTTIEWTDATWNPLRGCTAVSAGCDNCYAAGVAARFSGQGLAYEGLAVKGDDGRPEWTGKIMLVPDKLHEPIGWTRPRRIFVNSMSDLFHAGVPREFVDQVFAVMALTPHHTYQVLTKRPGRMAKYLNDRSTLDRIFNAGSAIWPLVRGKNYPPGLVRYTPDGVPIIWPLPNVWLGTSVESQQWADARIPDLIDCPAAVRFLSCEPLLGPLDLSPWLWETAGPEWAGANPSPDLGWIIAGGESGPRHRPIEPDWVRSLRDQCVAAGAPFFFKQWGGRRPKEHGRELDGRLWDQFPEWR